MDIFTIQKNIGSSPRKLRLVAGMIRKMSPERAIEQLGFTHNAAALPLMKAIKTALANAQGKTGLTLKKIEINEGLKMKRYLVGTAGRGRGRPFKRRLSHIKIVLTDVPVVKEDKKARVKKDQMVADEKLAQVKVEQTVKESKEEIKKEKENKAEEKKGEKGRGSEN